MKFLLRKQTTSLKFTCMIYCRQITLSLETSPLEILVHAPSTIPTASHFTLLPLLTHLQNKLSFLLPNTCLSRTRYKTRTAISSNTLPITAVIWNTFKPGHKLTIFYLRPAQRENTFMVICVAINGTRLLELGFSFTFTRL